MTQQNAALVEQAAAAGFSLEQQTADLAATVAKFQVGDEGAAAGALVSAYGVADKQDNTGDKAWENWEDWS
jgi:hypothetical protein